MFLSSLSAPRRRGCLTAMLVAAMCAASASSASAATYSWLPKSGLGTWTNASSWNLNSSYPGANAANLDQAQLQGDITGNMTVDLDAAASIQSLFLGDTAQTGGVFHTTTISTANASPLTFVAVASGTAVVSQVGGNSTGTENVVAPDVFVSASTLEFRNNLTSGGGANGQTNLAFTGNLTSGTAGNHILRFTYAGGSTNSLYADFRGNITDGAGVISLFIRKDNASTGTRLVRLSGTGNAFSGVIDLRGGPSNTVLEASPASGTNGALGTGRLDLGISGSSATLNLGGSVSTVTEVNGINIPGTGPRRIAVIGAGNRILSGTVSQNTTGGLTLACASSGNLTLSNTLSGVGPITISSTGSGKVIFGGINTHTGTTTVSQGTLQLDGSMPAAAVLSVGVAGLLTGSGTGSGTATIGGTLSPGATTGVLSLGSLVLSSTSTSLIDLLAAGTRGTDYDGVTILNGAGLTYGGTMSLSFGGGILPDNTTFNVFNFTGATTGSFAQIVSTGYYAGTWTDNLDGTFSLLKDAQTLTFSQATGAVNVMAVPEPAALGLVAAAVGGCWWRFRRRVWAHRKRDT